MPNSSVPANLDERTIRIDSAHVDAAGMADANPKPSRPLESPAILPFTFQELSSGDQESLEIEIGTNQMLRSDIQQLRRGKLITFDNSTADGIVLRRGDDVVARGQIVVTNDRIAIRITEVI